MRALTLRRVELIVAVTFATDVRDVQRFESPASAHGGILVSFPRERSPPYTGRERLDLQTSAKGRREKLYRLAQVSPTEELQRQRIEYIARFPVLDYHSAAVTEWTLDAYPEIACAVLCRCDMLHALCG